MSFDLIAPHYRWLENLAFGYALQKARTLFLNEIPRPQRVLIAGEGNGRFLRAFARKFPEAHIDCVDVSARMLSLASQQLQHEQNVVRFLQKDLLTWSPDESAYDLIVTHFFLDCFNESEVKAIVKRLALAATQNAIWFVADFSVPSESFAAMHARAWLWSMHHFFRIVADISARRLTDPSVFLEAHGFQCVHRRKLRFGLVKSEMWERPPCRDNK